MIDRKLRSPITARDVELVKRLICETVFGGDPSRWLEYLDTQASVKQRVTDRPWVEAMLRNR